VANLGGQERYIQALEQSHEYLEGSPRSGQIRRSLEFIAWAVQVAPAAWRSTFANDFAAAICAARALSQLNAAYELALFCSYAEVPTLLRGATESAGLARLLAKDIEKAEKWLREAAWIPDRQVRETLARPPEFRYQYRAWSDRTHTTLLACIPLVDGTEDGYRLRLGPEFKENFLAEALDSIALTAVFVCFAVRNCFPSEKAIPPVWRKRLADLAREVSPEDSWDHLERDWRAEQEAFDQIQRLVRPGDELEQELDTNPASWRSVRRKLRIDPSANKPDGTEPDR
jgi:hypothetical protein